MANNVVYICFVYGWIGLICVVWIKVFVGTGENCYICGGNLKTLN